MRWATSPKRGGICIMLTPILYYFVFSDILNTENATLIQWLVFDNLFYTEHNIKFNSNPVSVNILVVTGGTCKLSDSCNHIVVLVRNWGWLEKVLYVIGRWLFEYILHQYIHTNAASAFKPSLTTPFSCFLSNYCLTLLFLTFKQQLMSHFQHPPH